MIKKLLSFLILLLPAFLFAQSNASSSCDIIFTSVEQPPSLKISQTALEDTLTSILQSKKFKMNNSEIAYEFVLTDQSNVTDLRVKSYSGNISQEKILAETILGLGNLWAPAKQNGHLVCAYVQLKISFENKKLSIVLF